MAVTNRTCYVCGKRYYYCSTCSIPGEVYLPWKIQFDCENCRDIWYILCDYGNHKIDCYEAKELLTACDLSELESDLFQNSIKIIIDEIFAACEQ